jgi:hypothetical protein
LNDPTSLFDILGTSLLCERLISLWLAVFRKRPRGRITQAPTLIGCFVVKERGTALADRCGAVRSAQKRDYEAFF